MRELRITMRLIAQPTVTVTYVLDRILDAKEFINITRQNYAKVGAAIGRRRLAKLGVPAYPAHIELV